MFGSFPSDGFLLRCLEQNTSAFTPSEFVLNNGTSVRIVALGVIEFSPVKKTKNQKSIIYSCGIHGNETAPIEMCDQLVVDILNESVAIEHRLLVIFGNLEAMKNATRFIDENLNRLFCGAHSKVKETSNLERQRAALLEKCVEAFYSGSESNSQRIHYDLHTAIRSSINETFAVYPYLHGKPYCASQLAFMQRCNVNTILLSQTPTTTFSYYSSVVYGAHSFTVELGKVRPFGQNDMAKFAKADAALRALLVEDDLCLEVNHNDLMLYSVNQVVIKKKEDFRLHFDADTPNFTPFAKGAIIASERGRNIEAQVDQEAIVFPNADVPVGQRALLTVVPKSLNALSFDREPSNT